MVAELSGLISESKDNEVYIGDFNLPGVDWANGGRGREAAFVDAMQSKLMHQLIDFPTHVRGNILDLLITNIPERVKEVYDDGRLL